MSEENSALVNVATAENTAINVITVENVRGYVDENGTVWLNVEDVARGLGFIMTRRERVANSGDNFTTDGDNFYTAVRWARVNKYLREFGYPHEVGKDDFIPENMFYRLAMKANNQVAKNFQAKVADEILPAIRKYGSYTVDNANKNSEPQPVTILSQAKPSEVVIEIGVARDAIMDVYGAKNGIALAEATELAEIFYGRDLSRLKKLIPPATHEIGYLTPTEIGKYFNLSAQKINEKLSALGLQEKDGKNYRLTDSGKEYGEAFPFTRNGHSDYQVRWAPTVISLLSN